ncbi:15516_t:CDS:2, partial [Racocetra fulgida]
KSSTIKKAENNDLTNTEKFANTLQDKVNISARAVNDETLIISAKASNNNINLIKEDLITWNITFKKYNEIKISLKIEKLKHFVSLKQHYINLFYAATQETPNGSKSLPNKTKIEQ